MQDALSLSEESEIYQSKRKGSSFEMTFSVELTRGTVANNQQGKRVSDHDDNDGTLVTGEPFRIDSDGYKVFDATDGKEYRLSDAATDAVLTTVYVDPRPKYKYVSGNKGTMNTQGTGSRDDTFYVNTKRQVVDATGKLVYTLNGDGRRKAAEDDTNTAVDETVDDPYTYTLFDLQHPDGPIDVVDRFDYNEESIGIAVTSVPAGQSLDIRDKRDNQPAMPIMSENSHFAQLRNRVTLICTPAAVGTYMITIVDNTPSDDYPVNREPTNKADVVFTLYVTAEAIGTPTHSVESRGTTAGTTRVDTGAEVETVSARFAVYEQPGPQILILLLLLIITFVIRLFRVRGPCMWERLIGRTRLLFQT